MKYVIIWTLTFFLSAGIAIAQDASNLFPQDLNYKSIFLQTGLTLDDEEPEFELPNREIILSDITLYVDVPKMEFIYLNQQTGLQTNYITYSDTVFTRIIDLINFGFLDDLDLDLDFDVDLDIEVDLVRLSEEENSSWAIADERVTVEIPEELLELIPDGLTIRDEMDVRVRVSIQRLENETLDLPYGILETVVFKPTLNIDLIIQIQSFIGFIPVTLTLIQNYGTEVYFSEGYGVVKEYLAPIFVRARNTTLGIDIELGEIPGYQAELLEFGQDTGNSIERDLQLANAIELLPAYPNPFNPSTNIRYVLQTNSNVSITVFNSIGQMVKQLVTNSSQAAGLHTIPVDMSSYSSGVYHYSIQSFDSNGQFNQLSGSFTLLK